MASEKRNKRDLPSPKPQLLPPEIVKRIHEALAKGMHTKEVPDRFAALGASVHTNASPEEFVAYIKSEHALSGAR